MAKPLPTYDVNGWLIEKRPRETKLSPGLLLQVLEVVPARWHRFTPTMEMLHRAGKDVKDADGTYARYELLCGRAVRAQRGA